MVDQEITALDWALNNKRNYLMAKEKVKHEKEEDHDMEKFLERINSAECHD